VAAPPGLVPAAQHEVHPASAVRADQDVGSALARVPRGQRDPSAHPVHGAGKHGEAAAATPAREPLAAEVVPGDVDALAGNRPDLGGDAGRVTDIALDRAGDELALGGAGADEDAR